MNLSDFLDQTTPHENVPVPIQPATRWLAWGGVAALVVLVALLAFSAWLQAWVRSETGSAAVILGEGTIIDIATLWGHARQVLPLAAFLLVLAVGLAAWTVGFTRATARGQLASGGLAVLGGAAAVPAGAFVGVAAVNLALWIIVGILTLIATFLLLWVLLSGLTDS